MDIPGEVQYWLNRASVAELQETKGAEMENGLTSRMMLVMAIDEELHKRRTAALHRINALNDRPARFNKEIQDVLDSVIDTSDIRFSK